VEQDATSVAVIFSYCVVIRKDTVVNILGDLPPSVGFLCVHVISDLQLAEQTYKR